MVDFALMLNMTHGTNFVAFFTCGVEYECGAEYDLIDAQ